MSENYNSQVIDLESLLNETRSIAVFLLETFRNKMEPIEEFPPYITLLEQVERNFNEIMPIVENIIKKHE